MYVSPLLPWHNWRTIGPLVIILVSEDFKFSNTRPRLLRFLIQWEVACIVETDYARTVRFLHMVTATL